jgi:hypothetical protein
MFIMLRRAALLLIVAAALVSGCAALAPPVSAPVPSRTPTPAEKDEVRRLLVTPYIACMQTEARKLGDSGVAGAAAVDAGELKCGHRIQALRRYGAAKDYDALRWSDYTRQVEREGRAAAMTPTGDTTRARE